MSRWTLLWLPFLLLLTLTLEEWAFEWHDFKEQHGKSYPNIWEESYRFAVFFRNYRIIQRLKNSGSGATFGLSKFADLTAEEFAARYLSGRRGYGTDPGPKSTQVNVAGGSRPPCNIDWTQLGAVTPVQDQGACGSCWAFSAVEQVESMFFLEGLGPLLNLSVQQVVSCDDAAGGCNGGTPALAFDYIKGAGGLELAKSYPYSSGEGVSGPCLFDSQNLAVAVVDYVNVSSSAHQEGIMGDYICQVGPLSICVDASLWQFYLGGIVGRDCGRRLNHCVQAVGLVASGPEPYWIVRNQWGTDWGVDGYIYLKYGENTCGLAEEATTVNTARVLPNQCHQS